MLAAPSKTCPTRDRRSTQRTSYRALEKRKCKLQALIPVINPYDDYGYIGWQALYHSCMQQAECIHTWSGVTSLSDHGHIHMQTCQARGSPPETLCNPLQDTVQANRGNDRSRGWHLPLTYNAKRHSYDIIHTHI